MGKRVADERQPPPCIVKGVRVEGGPQMLQLSLDGTQPPKFHFELGRRLAALRNDVLIFATGALAGQAARPQSPGRPAFA